MPDFSKPGMLAAFGELATILQRDGERGRIYVAGGAAMMLAHESDRLTRDIDASIDDGHGAVTRAAHQIAQRHRWPRSWLNEQATAYMPAPKQRRGTVVFDHPSLKVVAASKEHLLAMKARAARTADKGDVEQLLSDCEYETVEQVDALVTDVFGEGLGDRQCLWLQTVLDELHHVEPADEESTGLSPSSGGLRASALPSLPERCGKWMPLAKRRCNRPQRHNGGCR